jgi:hypothetical protein
MRNDYSILVWKPEGKRPLGRPRRRWKNNIRMDLREIGWEVVDWFIWLRTGNSDGRLWRRGFSWLAEWQLASQEGLCSTELVGWLGVPGIHWIGGWVRSQNQSGRGGEEKNSQPLPGLELPIIQPVGQRYTTELSGSWWGMMCGWFILHCDVLHTAMPILSRCLPLMTTSIWKNISLYVYCRAVIVQSVYRLGYWLDDRGSILCRDC